jgi:hypothetical protein
MAREALARQRAGQNPVLHENPGAASALQTAQAFATQKGLTPESAFAMRFTATPPAGEASQ